MRLCSRSRKQVLKCLLVPLCIYCGYVYIKEIEPAVDTRSKAYAKKIFERNLYGQTLLGKINRDRLHVASNGDATKKQPDAATASRETQTVAFYVINNLTLQLFQPTDEVEFPNRPHGDFRIPHIIHQIYTNESVPEIFVGNMKSFVKHNPTWEYRFWSYASGGQLIKKRYPYLLQTYNSFSDRVKKADLLRYVLLYEYGGMYADLDVENIRSLDITTTKYPCICPTEPFEHSSIFSSNGSFIIMNSGVLLCKAKHPFYRNLLNELKRITDPGAHPFGLTGPGFLSRMFMKYSNFTRNDIKAGRLKKMDGTNSPYFYRGTRNPEDDDGIYVPNTQYFMDNVDTAFVNKNYNILNVCLTGKPLPVTILRACAEFESRKGLRNRKTYTFTIHYWIHLWTLTHGFVKSLPTVHIRDIVPTAVLYSSV